MNFDDELGALVDRALAEGVDVNAIFGSLDLRREELLCQIIWARLQCGIEKVEETE